MPLFKASKMTGRRLLIEQKLIGLNGAAFQEVGDAYLSLRTNDVAHYGRPGSQVGKQKTVKGTPDAFIRHTDGSLSVIEHTTTTDGLLKKLKADINKCLDPTVTKVSVKDITRILLCFNSRLSLAHDYLCNRSNNHIPFLKRICAPVDIFF